MTLGGSFPATSLAASSRLATGVPLVYAAAVVAGAVSSSLDAAAVVRIRASSVRASLVSATAPCTWPSSVERSARRGAEFAHVSGGGLAFVIHSGALGWRPEASLMLVAKDRSPMRAGDGPGPITTPASGSENPTVWSR